MQTRRLVTRKMMKNDLHFGFECGYHERHEMRLWHTKTTDTLNMWESQLNINLRFSIYVINICIHNDSMIFTRRQQIANSKSIQKDGCFRENHNNSSVQSIPLSLSPPLTLACSPSTLKKILWSLKVGSRVRAPKIQRLYISRWLNLYSPLYFKWKRRATYLHSISERHLFMLILIHFSPPLPLSSHQFAMPLRVYNCSIIIIIIIIKANINITKKILPTAFHISGLLCSVCLRIGLKTE